MVCTHELALVEPYLNRVLVMAHGAMQGVGTLDELRRVGGLPVTIARISSEICNKDASIGRWREGGVLRVPEEQSQDVIERLTKEHGCFDFEVRKADLGEIFRRFAGDTVK